MRILLLVVLGTLLFSCKDPKKDVREEESSPADTVNASPDSIPGITQVTADPYFDSDEHLAVKSIESINNQGFVVPQFDEFAILQKLLPGNPYLRKGFEKDTVKMVVWQCDKCPSAKYVGWYESEALDFPGKTAYDTRLLKTLSYESDGEKYLLMSFYSAVFEETVTHTGRFNSPMLGMALFRQVPEGYKLETVNTALGLHGSFGTSPQPKLLQLGKGIFFYIDDINGPAGGPFYSNAYLFGIYSNRIQEVLEIRNATRVYSGYNDWNTAIEPAEKSLNKFPVLRTSRKGMYSPEIFEEWELENFPQEIKDAAAKQKEFSYEIFTYFRWDNGKYVKNNTKLTLGAYIPPNTSE